MDSKQGKDLTITQQTEPKAVSSSGSSVAILSQDEFIVWPTTRAHSISSRALEMPHGIVLPYFRKDGMD